MNKKRFYNLNNASVQHWGVAFKTREIVCDQTSKIHTSNVSHELCAFLDVHIFVQHNIKTEYARPTGIEIESSQ